MKSKSCITHQMSGVTQLDCTLRKGSHRTNEKNVSLVNITDGGGGGVRRK